MVKELGFGGPTHGCGRGSLCAALSFASVLVLLQGGCSEEENPVQAATWIDPGTVPNPEVVAVAEAAGQTGHLFGQSKDLDPGYLEEEFFFTGTAPAYTSRMVVHRPKDPAAFSGTVFMEWYNVTGGVDMGVMWALNREYFIREGHVHVGVSAQQVGADALKTYNAERYAAINHPGDDAANAIFSQAAVAMRTQTQLLLGPRMSVHTLLAGGQSQSSGRLASYIDTVPPMERFYDGYLLHSGGTPTSNPDVPVFLVFTMMEADGILVDAPNIVEWEVAGASHSDAYITRRGNEEQARALGIMSSECASPMNEYPAYRVYNAAIDWLNRWVRKGERPPSGDPLQPGQVDQYGNSVGGVRLPDIEVPIATYTATGDVASNLFGFLSTLDLVSTFTCLAGGGTAPLTKQQLLELYPTHEDYVRKYTSVADEALAKGYLLPADYEVAVQSAKAASVPN